MIPFDMGAAPATRAFQLLPIWANGRKTGSYPETAFEETYRRSTFLEPEFSPGTTSG